MRDEGLHEYQLRGKQLVFLFMTATVVAVAIFLSGVMVGRGVRAQRNAEAQAVIDVTADPTVSQPPALSPGPSVSGALLSSQEKLTYPDRLSDEDPTVESLAIATPGAEAVAEPAQGVETVPAVPARSESVADGELGRDGFVVQVAAVREQNDADTMARRLTAKGYPAFVATSADGPARFYRVRVGRYDTRREAESVAARLLKEEQFKPWITR